MKSNDFPQRQLKMCLVMKKNGEEEKFLFQVITAEKAYLDQLEKRWC